MKPEKQSLIPAYQSKFLLLLFVVLLSSLPIYSYPQKNGSIPLQQLRGIVIDQVLQRPIQGATVIITALKKGTVTDAKGEFRFTKVPVGVQQVAVSHVGYKETVIDNITINSGKETVLTISIEDSIKIADVVVIRVNSKRNKPLNEMSSISARAFTVEETQKYAAAVNDPLRMATGFPGVMIVDDGNNDIVIRGNSPMGLLWRMEGVDIPNPNHFSSTGSSGGGISILSAQLLSNSDFITGAFAAEYGNALSGVFDLKLRKGNNEKKEYNLEAGLLGLNIASEGPISHSHSGSYLVNYRYSTLELLKHIGIPFESSSTNFQDLSYNIYLPTNKCGTFTLFGFGGLSSENTRALTDSSKWMSIDDRYSSQFISNTGVSGITHNVLLGTKTSLRSAAAFSYNKISDNSQYIKDDYSSREDYRDNYETKKLTITSTVNHKFSAKASLRAGTIISFIAFDYFQKSRAKDSDPIKELINAKDHTQTVQGFVQGQYKPFDRLTVNGGLHYLQLFYNKTNSIEPRASVKWQANQKNSFAAGYGHHSQMQALGIYFAESKNTSGLTNYPNHDLGLTKANHCVFSYQYSFNKNLALKLDLYYQRLYNVPISIYDTSTFSVLNVGSEYVTDPLVNKGKGKNYGIELSLEKYLANYFYYTINASLYQSKYTAADDIERNTRFNGNHIISLVAGKEFVFRNRLKTFGINTKVIHAGGLRTTPIDVNKSIREGYAVYRDKEAFTLQNKDYFRADLRLNMKWNSKRLTSVLSLDIQNLTGRLNVYGQWFDTNQNKLITAYQNGLIPVLNYKVEF